MIIKNSNIRRNIFENRYVIFMIIFAIILALYLIRVLNTKASQRNMAKNNETKNVVIGEQKKDISNKPVISGTEVEQKVQENNIQLIETFIGYCNNNEIEKAYALLTDECKKEVFSSNIQYFKVNYVDKIFTSKKMGNIQAWMNIYGSTYKVTFSNDVMSTGKITSSENAIEDYYTIIQQNNSYKLNINNYIGRAILNKETISNGIKITVLCKNIFKEYESYDIRVENMNSNTILLDSQEKVDTVFLVGSNENQYKAFLYEVDKNDWLIQTNKEKNLTIRFNKIYSNQSVVRQIVFSDVIMDYSEYEKMPNKQQYTKRQTIIVEI